LLAIWVSAVFWTSVYYGLFLLSFIALYGVVQGGVVLYNRKRKAENGNDEREEDRSLRSAFRSGLLALALATLLLFPVIAGQLRYTSEYTRSDATIQNNSAQPIDYLRLGSRTWGNRLPWLVQDRGSGQRLYPGMGLLLLGIVGAVVGWRGGNRLWVLYALLSIPLAFWLSLGLNGYIGDFRQYDLIREWVPGYRQLRSPFRLALFVQLFLVTLAGVGLTVLFRKQELSSATKQTLGSRLKGIIPFLAVGFAIVEVLSFPARLYAVPPRTFDAEWLTWFRAQPAGAAVYVPFVEGSQASNYEATTLTMIQALTHRHPLANGYSGFFPARHDTLKAQMQDFPSFRAITSLQAIGVRYIIVARDWEFLTSVLQWKMLTEQYRDEEVVIFEIDR
jgi:hypothetical protein